MCASGQTHGQGIALPAAFVPACDLTQLNVAYVAELNHQRKLVNPKAKLVQVDAAMLPSTILFNAVLQQRDSLFHDKSHQNVELVGMSSDLRLQSTDPQLLAKYIYHCFAQSAMGHCEAQDDFTLCHVAISCSENYFVVRLNIVASPIFKRQ